MKKTLLASLILPMTMALFFSCKSTQGVAENSEQKQEIQEAQTEEASASDESEKSPILEEKIEDSNTAANSDLSAWEEKIPQSEVDEFKKLLESERDELANKGGEKDDESEAKILQSENDSLAEKIKSSNDESLQKQAEEMAHSQTNSQSEETAAPLQDGRDASVIVSSASAKGQDDSSDGTKRVTSKENEVQGGPLIGPNSDKQNAAKASQGASMAASGTTAATQSLPAVSTAASEAQTNEAISLLPPQEEEAQDEEEKKEPPKPSRSMTLKNNQFVDIVYPGNGWIYLGEEGSGDHFIFQGRKLGNGNTTFTLRSKEPGTALLHFYKNDILTGDYIDDYIQITIGDKSATDASHVEAPSYAEAVPPKFDRSKKTAEKIASQKSIEEKKSEAVAKTESAQKSEPVAEQKKPETQTEPSASPSEKVQTVIQTAGQDKNESKQKTAVAGTSPAASSKDKAAQSSSEQNYSGASDKAASLLERAQKAYDENRFAEALDLIQQFFEAATDDIDAGLFLEGLILEAKSEVRNIKSAIGAYDTLIKNWPQSPYWRRANERSIYLKRFYIDIR